MAAEQEQEAEFEIAELFDDIGSAALDDEDLIKIRNRSGRESESETADDINPNNILIQIKI